MTSKSSEKHISPAAAAASGTSPLGYDGGLTCSIKVKDIEQSIAFYRDILGFRLLYHLKDMAWCELATEVPGVNVGLGQVEKPDLLSGTKLTFGVKDIDAARALLESKKVRFDGPTITIPNMVKLATFFDNTGNALMFYQSLDQAGG